MHRIFSVSLKHGPVIFTIVPPNMFPLSGANTRGKFDPAIKHYYFILTYHTLLLLTIIIYVFNFTNILIANCRQYYFIYSKHMTSWKIICPSSSGQITDGRSLRERFIFVTLCTVPSVKTNLKKRKRLIPMD